MPSRGWNPTEADPDRHWAVDREVGRTKPGSQRLNARPGRPVGVRKCKGYSTVMPGRYYAAEAWVRGRGVKLGEGGGLSVSLSITDPGGPYVIWTPRRPSHKAWSHFELTAVANTNRMAVFLDAYHVMGRGFVLYIFDDVTFHKSEQALPGELSLLPESSA